MSWGNFVKAPVDRVINMDSLITTNNTSQRPLIVFLCVLCELKRLRFRDQKGARESPELKTKKGRYRKRIGNGSVCYPLPILLRSHPLSIHSRISAKDSPRFFSTFCPSSVKYSRLFLIRIKSRVIRGYRD